MSNTPGVIIKEVAKLPPSVVGVATAVPAFLGYTQKHVDELGESLVNVPKRITSMLEYIRFFGEAGGEDMAVNVAENDGEFAVTFAGDPPAVPASRLYYSMILYFANGGGPCWIVSLGNTLNDFAAELTAGLTALTLKDEPTLVVCPDAAIGPNADNPDNATVANAKTFIEQALNHCVSLQDRFVIADVPAAIPEAKDKTRELAGEYRNAVPAGKDIRKYGCAYFPFLKTDIPFFKDYTKVTVNFTDDTGNPAQKTLEGNDPIPADGAMYNAVADFVRRKARVTLPPSGAIAGVFAAVDRSRGVFKAPANVSVARVIEPALGMTNDLNGFLNVDAGTGKSINVIRTFFGKGHLVWGARTLAGNDNEWRYVNVRRFYIYVEESCKKASEGFVFEGNNANTWAKVRSMIESFLVKEWRDGALMGAKPDDAFYVKVGLGQTMSAQDVLEGRMIVEIGMAAVRPAEFIILEFSHMLPTS